ncbi:hypothetical protein DOK67_0001767 [Enterococcus sp. DIV0212c]|uniref:prepilin-type N-terminal cleavage/methylation domain-containing protein n=1 Tax=Enterococcus sp. DIV0212c TaxID=2230867 RepID=UPI001A9BFBD7|nr:prepilin-type N-terminal cleavage/methylation domain-containing protein [Enterococcus sp. DIV0212c]MBO1353833.1 prepilin-type N-terminal cleavage/methylation domain-containing protein [Enterococcus sp. DIV0212c]
MSRILKDEDGLTLIEMIATLAIFSIVILFFGAIIGSIGKAFSIQGQKVEFQQTANDIVAQINQLSKKKGLYEKAGYLGKFPTTASSGNPWQTDQIISVFDSEATNQKPIDLTEQGKNKIGLTDILDATKDSGKNSEARFYRLKNQEYKIKIFQQKNKNESLKTQFKTPNYRDTFTIQTSVTILFYKGTIDFNRYVKNGEINLSGKDGVEEKEAAAILYSRKAEFTYRDELKAKGEIPGEGRW